MNSLAVLNLKSDELPDDERRPADERYCRPHVFPPEPLYSKPENQSKNCEYDCQTIDHIKRDWNASGKRHQSGIKAHDENTH